MSGGRKSEGYGGLTAEECSLIFATMCARPLTWEETVPQREAFRKACRIMSRKGDADFDRFVRKAVEKGKGAPLTWDERAMMERRLALYHD